MTEVVDTSDGGSVQIHASKSDLSIAHSSPRLESNATTSTACINDVQPLRRDLSSDLLCPLCDHLFDRPVMVTCGHSYCEPCIERHTRNTRSCVICKHDVGPFEAMIPSITLDNMVRKLKNEDIIESSYEESFVSEEKLQKESQSAEGSQQHQQKLIDPPKLVRTMSQKRRLFFSIAGPTICSSPITPHRRRPLSPSARPTKSSLKIPPESNNFHQSLSPEAPDEKNQTADESIIAAASAMFRRNGFGRRSERYTSATMGSSMSDLEESLSPRGKPEAEEPKLKRNSFLRRSLNAFRSKSKRHNTASTTRVAPIPEESLPLFSEDEDEETTTPSQQKDKKSSMKSLWKRLFVSKKGKVSADGASGQVQLLRHQKKEEGSFFNDTISFVRLQNEHDDPSADSVSPPNIGNFALGYYMGIGRKFERIAGGSEITLVVFGHAGAGKTTLVRSIRQLFLDGTSDRIRVIPLAERYRLAGIGMMPYPEGDNRLPHIVSLIINISDDVEHVLDIIDPEYDNTNLPQAYMDACDAALLLIDARNCASLLSAHQIHRNMKSAKHAHVQCEMLMNIPSESSGQSRALSSNALETTMSKGAPIKELCVTQLARAEVQEVCLCVPMSTYPHFQILISMCERVSTARIPTAIPTSIPTTS
ncbi:Protein CBR-PAR-2 [Caenorhabditis briggsae]|uniref:Protein CBR-PAR-2 n=1 Tax=Caenorhabditis briggsae TaxID=6238 RepID=A8XLT6_CAEBR|nr:Protein CBR-PAR-2 [Caenorhabditis briggsae]CAP33590.3 Protein CBR-PAR-2 [Caenorhabditis briggsae]